MSRTDHPRLMGTHRAGRYYPCSGCYYCDLRKPSVSEREAISEGIAAYLDEREPAKVTLTINQAHAEALAIHAEFYADDEEDEYGEIEYLAHLDEVDLLGSWPNNGGPNMYTRDPDCWMPLVQTMTECRDIFGGTDFTILHANVARR